MDHSLKTAQPNRSILEVGKLIDNHGYTPLLHTKLYLDVAAEIISPKLSHSSILFTINIKNLSLASRNRLLQLVTPHIGFVNDHQCFDRCP